MSSWCQTHYCQDDCGTKDPRTAQLDEVSEWLSKAPKSKQGDMYKALYNLGWRISDIDHEIAKAWKDEVKK